MKYKYTRSLAIASIKKLKGVSYTNDMLIDAITEILKTVDEPTREDLVKEIFDVVYQWGHLGIKTDHNSKTYRSLIEKLLNSKQK